MKTILITLSVVVFLIVILGAWAFCKIASAADKAEEYMSDNL